MTAETRPQSIPGKRRRPCPHEDCDGSFAHLAEHYRRKHGGQLPQRQRLRPHTTCSVCNRVYSQAHRKRHIDKWHPSEAPNDTTLSRSQSAAATAEDNPHEHYLESGQPSLSHDQVTPVTGFTRRAGQTHPTRNHRDAAEMTPAQAQCSGPSHKQTASCLVDPNEEAHLCSEFRRLSQTWRLELLIHWKQRLATLEARPMCRQREELQHHISDLERAKPLVVIGAMQYRDMLRDDGESCFLRNEAVHIVLCHWRDAEDLLSLKPPRVSLVVPREWGSTTEDKLNIKDFWLYLRDTKVELDVHVPCEIEDPFDKSARRRDTSRAIAQLHATDADEINLLNLATLSGDVQPKWTSHVRALQLLPVVPDLNVAGKESKESLTDLSNNAGFHICSNHGTASLAHWDRQGCSTVVKVQSARKSWLQWKMFTDSEAIDWAHDLKLNTSRRRSGQHEIFSPKSCPSVVPLRKGDEMYQPRGTVHAPASMRDDESEYCLATGAMMWDVRDLIGIARQSLFEQFSQNMVTNEEPANEFGMKASHITRMWSEALHRDSGSEQYFSWGSAEELAIWKQFVMAYHGKSKGCNCTGDCQKNKCPCKLKRRQCTVICHILPKARKHNEPRSPCRNAGQLL